jgi:glycosyl transferase family 1
VDPNASTRRDSPSSLDELDAVRAERDALARRLADLERRARRRRDRFEAELERRDQRHEHDARRVANRDKNLAKAQADLALPLVSTVVRVDRFVSRVARRIRRSLPGGRGATATRMPVPSPDARTFRASLIRAIDAGSLSVAIATAAMPAVADTTARKLADALAARGWRVMSVGPLADAHQDPAPDIVIAIGPNVPRRAIPPTAVAVAWVTTWDGDAAASHELDDYDLVLTDTDAAAAAIARDTSQRAVAVDPRSFADGAQVAIRSWVDAPKLAIHIAPKSWEAAATWGDTAFARSVQRSLARRGRPASVLIAPEVDDPRAIRADVALHLSGIATPPVRPGQPSVLWVISHPDRVRAAAVDAYDLVFVASEPFAADLAPRVERPVHVLLQATDPDRFHPEPGGPTHELLFVGNSRGVRRPVLETLAAAGHDVAVYGGNWKPEFIDPALVKGSWIPNADLHRYYAGAAIVLSDHWEDMREEGFVSNRVYDALASGAFVVSDRVAGMAAALDDAVAEYDDDAGLLAVVEHALAHPDERRARAERGRALVLAHHTFDHRAASIDAALVDAGIWPRGG